MMLGVWSFAGDALVTPVSDVLQPGRKLAYEVRLQLMF